SDSFFFFPRPPTPQIYTLSLHDALPISGESRPYGDFLTNAQGEDVVAGIRVTEPLDQMADDFPECHRQLLEVMNTLERHYRDMRSEEHTSELQSPCNLVCRLLLEKKKKK